MNGGQVQADGNFGVVSQTQITYLDKLVEQAEEGLRIATEAPEELRPEAIDDAGARYIALGQQLRLNTRCHGLDHPSLQPYRDSYHDGVARLDKIRQG